MNPGEKPENQEREKIRHINETRTKAHSWFMEKSHAYQLFVDMEQRTYSNGALSKKQKELISS